MTPADEFVAELAQALEDVSDPSTKEWWDRYLRGDAQFRGVKMADTRRIVDALANCSAHSAGAPISGRASSK